MAKFKSDDLHQFSFRRISCGAYIVRYTTDIRRDYWEARIEEMMLIDATYNADFARAKDIIALYKAIKRKGVHFSADGKRLYCYL